MYSDWVWSALGGFLTVWLMGVSFLIWKQSNFLKTLFPKSGQRDIRKKFEEVLRQIEEFGSELQDLKSKILEVRNSGLVHIQKVELNRYNPYDDTGGDQSFSLALLNEKGTGFVLTSLHARSGTRVFAKPVLEGRAGKYQFSKEEGDVIREAMKNS